MGARTQKTAKFLGQVSAIALVCGAISAPAYAQDSNSDEAESGDPIIVTGSRIGRSTFDTPNPVSVMGEEEIQNLGLTNVGEVLEQLPQNNNQYSPAGQSGSNFNTGSTIANLRGLNPVFGTRTLTLIDTRRVVPTGIGGEVDLNVVPSLLVQRVETVTGGASAAYGSDAVAGVVNVILDSKFEGFKAQMDYGFTSRGDGKDYHGAAAYGTSFSDGRGNLVLGGEYQKSDAVENCGEVRAWCGESNAIFENTAYTATGGPRYIIGPNAMTNNTLNGVLYSAAFVPFPTSGALLGQLDDAGTSILPYDAGNYGGPDSLSPRQGGDGVGVGQYDRAILLPNIERYSLFGHLSYDITDDIEGFIEASYSRRDAGTYQTQALRGQYIAGDNAFLSPAMAAAIGPGGGFLHRSGNNLDEFANNVTDKVWRVAGGLNGSLTDSWNWDVYAQYGKHTSDGVVENNQTGANYANAVDAVLTDPTMPYNPVTNPAVCRSGAPGCQPLNLFGSNPGAINPNQAAAFGYAFLPLVDDVDNSQFVVAANISGDLFEGFGAGPIGMAVGAEFRRDKVTDLHDVDSGFYYQFFANYGDPFSGKIDVLEGYVEVNVPLLSGIPGIDYLEVNGAIRQTQNKTTGSIDRLANTNLLPIDRVVDDFSNTENFTTWKVGAVWDITDWARVRATRSRDVRAPAFQQLFTQNVFGFVPFFVVNDGTTSFNPNSILGGNPALTPEKADTTTLGLVLSPAPGLQISADWYEIKMDDVISALPSGLSGPLQPYLDGCLNGVASFCQFINDGNYTLGDPITLVQAPRLNLGGLTNRGVDIEVAYSTSLGNGDISVRGVASHVYDVILDTGTGGPPLNYAGQGTPTGGFSSPFNPSPKWQGNAFVTYSNGPFQGTVQVRYLGKSTAQVDLVECATGPCGPNSINDNSIDSVTYVNLSTSYSLNDNLQLFGRVDNLFDKDPPIAISPGGNQGASSPTNPGLFDPMGTSFRVGARLNF